MFDNRKQSVPKIFRDKIEIDKVIDAFKKIKVVTFEQVKEIQPSYKRQREIRRLCQMHCHMNKVDQDGDGSPAGGTVGRYLDTYAVAA